jgi:hypothetical protein
MKIHKTTRCLKTDPKIQLSHIGKILSTTQNGEGEQERRKKGMDIQITVSNSN